MPYIKQILKGLSASLLLPLFLSSSLHAQGSCASPDGPMKDYSGGNLSYGSATTVSGGCYTNLTAGQTYCFYFYYPTNTTVEFEWVTNGCADCSKIYLSMNSSTGSYGASTTGGTGCSINSPGPSGNCGHVDISGTVACTDCAPELYDKNCSLIFSNGLMGGNGCPMTNGDKYTYCFKVPATCGGMSICPLVKCATGGCASLMPVEMLSFTGKSECEKNSLTWTTATEKDNDYFSIERSPDASNYEPIGTVKGSGNSSTPHTYEFIDSHLEISNQEQVYYRIKQVDFNGKFEYYGPVALANSCETVSIFPSPANEAVYVRFGKAYDNAVLTVCDALGKTILAETITRGELQKKIDVSSLAAGIYFIRISSSSENIVRKIIVSP